MWDGAAWNRGKEHLVINQAIEVVYLEKLDSFSYLSPTVLGFAVFTYSDARGSPGALDVACTCPARSRPSCIFRTGPGSSYRVVA